MTEPRSSWAEAVVLDPLKSPILRLSLRLEPLKLEPLRGGALGIALSLIGLGWAGHAIAQTAPATLPLDGPTEGLEQDYPDPDLLEQPREAEHGPEAEDFAGSAAAARPVALTLADTILLTLTGNRTLQNNQLERIVQRQELREAEQAFDPRLTPTLGASVTRRLSAGGPELIDPVTGEILFRDSAVRRESRALLEAAVNTRQGTAIRVGADPINGDRLLNVEVVQPLLRGFGTAVNEAPVNQARLGETLNQLELQATVIDLITQSTLGYTSLISAQTQVDIQSQALERRQQQLEILRALVAAGRRAEIDLFDTERSVADAERSLVEAQNALNQANNNLLNLIGTDQNLRFVASPETVDRLFVEALDRVSEYDRDRLVATALAQRPDYRQAQIVRQQLELGQILAEDALRWQVNAVAGGSVGNLSTTTLGLVATRTFNEPQLDTNRVRSQISLQQQDNTLAQQQEQIRNDVAARLADVQATQLQVEAAERATLSARRQLEADQEQYRLGRGQVSLFEIINREEALVAAQTNELEARVALLNSIAELERTVGITLDRWAAELDVSPFVVEGEE